MCKMRYHTVIQVSIITSRTLRFYCACFDSSSVTAELTDFFVTNFMVNDKLVTRIFTHEFFLPHTSMICRLYFYLQI